MKQPNALTRSVSKKSRLSPHRECQQHAQRPRLIKTAHLHRQGAAAESRCERERRHKYQVLSEYEEWIPCLNTRADFTLQKRALVTTIDLGNPDPTIPKGKKVTATRLVNAAGKVVASQRTVIPHEVNYVAQYATPVTDDLINQIVCRFTNRLNRCALRRHRRGEYQPRLNTMIFLERGKFGRLHLHVLIERPVQIRPKRFAGYVRKAWKRQPGAGRIMDVQQVDSTHESLTYNAKAADALYQIVYQHKEPDDRAYWRAPEAQAVTPYTKAASGFVGLGDAALVTARPSGTAAAYEGNEPKYQSEHDHPTAL